MPIPPLSTFNALCIEIADWLDRPSTNDPTNADVLISRPTLGPVVPTFIKLAEVQMNRRLDTRQMTNTIAISLDENGGFDLPDDFGGADGLALNFPQIGDTILSTQDQTLLTESGYLAYGSSFWPSNLVWVSQNTIDEINARQFQYVGLPRFCCVTANRINFAPTFSAIELTTPITGTMTYRRTLPPLSPINPTNWMLQSNPDVYLFGGCYTGSAYLKDADAATAYESLFMSALADVGIESLREEQPAVLRMRAAVYV